MKKLSIRALAAQALAPVLAGKSSLGATQPPAQQACLPRDRPLLQNLVLGCTREWVYLEALLRPLLQQPVKDKAVLALLGLGLYQLLRTRIPPHAAIGETVEAAKELGFGRAAGLINALLRRFLREQQDLLAAGVGFEHAHPGWLKKRLEKDWPEHAAAILAANNEPGPLTLRVNRRRLTRNDYLVKLLEAGISAEPSALSPEGIRLHELHDVTALPGYAEGEFSVQDESAQLAAGLLAPAAGSVVLDACAAPGGKTAHLLETADPQQLWAIDSDAGRLERVRENLRRLQLDGPAPTLLAADAADPDAWAGDTRFDAILLDAPCTGTGVIRRHPDIKLLRKPDDIGRTVDLQAKILRALWTRLQPGGRLLYATCSVIRAENENQIGFFLKQTPDAREVKIDATWGMERPHGRQILPTIGGGDGFFYAVLEKAVTR